MSSDFNLYFDFTFFNSFLIPSLLTPAPFVVNMKKIHLSIIPKKKKLMRKSASAKDYTTTYRERGAFWFYGIGMIFYYMIVGSNMNERNMLFSMARVFHGAGNLFCTTMMTWMIGENCGMAFGSAALLLQTAQ